MKKLFTLFLMMLLPLMASAAVEIDGIYYNLNSSGETKTATVRDGSTKYSGEVVIPEYVTYEDVTYSVTSIGDEAFYGCTGLTSVTIPNSVTSIGSYAFDRCSSLTLVSIPNGVAKIGIYAFRACSSLISISIPNSVVEIGYCAFSGCSSLTSVTIPNSVTSIGYDIFSGCSALMSLVLEDGNPIYDSRNNCNAIIETATNLLIHGCNNTVIPNSVVSIGSFAFRGCSGISSMSIPNSVISIGSYAFEDCSCMTSVTIGNSVTDIGYSAFSGCSSLTSIDIPNSVTSIGVNAFYGTAWYDNQPDGVVYAGNVLYRYKGTMPEGTSLFVKEGTVCITNDAFNGCSGLTSITIPNSVKSMGSATFSRCNNLSSVIIGNSVTSIENEVFYYCSNLASIDIPNSVTSIGRMAFGYCSSLTSIHIPNSVTSIGAGAFDGTAWYDNQPDGTIYAGKVLYEYKGIMPEGTSLSIEEGTLGITAGAFQGCGGITSVTIPKSVTNIGELAFLGCRKIVDVYCYAETAPILGLNAFSYLESDGMDDITVSLIPKITLHVLDKFMEAYKSTSPWDQFKEIVAIEEEEETAEDINNETELSLLKVSYDGLKEFPYLGLFSYEGTGATLEMVSDGVAITNPQRQDNHWDTQSQVTEECLTLEKGHTYIVRMTLKVPSDGDYVVRLGNWDTCIQYGVNVTASDEWQVIDVEFPNFDSTVEGDGHVVFQNGWVVGTTILKSIEVLELQREYEIEEELAEEDVIKISSAGQTTWCSAYDLDFTNVEGLKAYIASGYDRETGTIWLTRVKKVPAKEGILLIGDAGDYKVPHLSTTAYYANLMVGTIEAITINETDGEYTNYYLSNGDYGVGFYKVNGSVDIKANRAYLPLLKNTVSSTRGFIGIDFDDDAEGTTGINDVQKRVAEHNVYYNLQGQRVDKLNKGIYIKNGKKVVIK